MILPPRYDQCSLVVEHPWYYQIKCPSIGSRNEQTSLGRTSKELLTNLNRKAMRSSEKFPPPLWTVLSVSTYCTNDPDHAVEEPVNRPLTNLFLRSRYREKWRLPIESILATNKIRNLGRPPWLCGLVCAYHPAAPGSNPKHAIYAFFTLYYCNIEIVMRKIKTYTVYWGLDSFVTSQGEPTMRQVLANLTREDHQLKR